MSGTSKETLYLHNFDDEFYLAFNRRLKDQRKKQQEKNLDTKQAAREQHQHKTLAGMKRKKEEEEEDSGAEDPGQCYCRTKEGAVEFVFIRIF